MNTSLLRSVGFLIVLSVAGFLAGCSSKEEAVETPPPVVTVSQPVMKTITDFKPFTGRTQAPDSVEIRAQVTGYLDSVNFRPGDLVKKDDVLFIIDPRPYKATLDKVLGEKKRAESSLDRWDAEYERAKGLVGTKAMSRQEFERIQGERGEAEGSLMMARAQLVQAKLDLSWTTVKAPITGIVSRNLISVGNLVTAKVTELTTIVSEDPMYAYFNVDERTLLNMREIMRKKKMKTYLEAKYPVYLGLANEKGYPHAGTIDFANNQVDAGTGTISVRGSFPNKDGVLTPGLFARISLPMGEQPDALLVTDRALGTDQGQKFVYVVDKDNVVQLRPVTVGALHGGLRIIEQGIKKGDWIIVNGLQRVRPGVTVKPKKVEMPVPPGGANQDPVVKNANSSGRGKAKK
jgi:RND family efflux transporter MFP subunit